MANCSLRGGPIVTNAGDRQSCGGAVLQQAGDGAAIDRGGLAGGKGDPAELPSVPIQRGEAVAERDGMQVGKSLAVADAAEEDREVVPSQLAAKVGEGGGRLVRHARYCG